MRRMLAMLAAISASLSSCRVSSLPEGSPTLVVPPPISTIGLLPVFCHSRSSMICSEIADMEAVGGAIEADIGRQRPRREARVERLAVGALMDEAALFGGGEKGRAGGGHGAVPWGART